jgi:gluconolactonase
MQITRRHMLGASAGAITLATAPRVLAGWEPTLRYPDPAVHILDPSFARYRVPQASVEQLFTGTRWSEGPVWMGDARCLLWSDIPNNRMMRWDEVTGRTDVFRQPSLQRARPRPRGPPRHLRAQHAPPDAHGA